MSETRTAVVTGSTSGIGRALALAFAGEGYRVIVHGTSEQRAGEVVAEIAALGGQAEAVLGDVANASVAEALCVSGVDVFVANAGKVLMGDFLDYTLKDFLRSLDVNLTGAFLGCQAAARRMVAQGRGGRLLTIASVGANMGQFGFAGYGTAKSALLGLTRVMAVELARYNITANCLVPGPVMNEMLLGVYGEERLRQREKTIPLGRLAGAQDVVEMALFLSSEKAAYLTGQQFVIDGGASAAGAFTMEVYRRSNSD